jgi:hypothetical protein
MRYSVWCISGAMKDVEAIDYIDSETADSNKTLLYKALFPKQGNVYFLVFLCSSCQAWFRSLFGMILILLASIIPSTSAIRSSVAG